MNENANGNGQKFRVQTWALGVALVAPFALFLALQSGLTALATLFFGVIALSMFLTIWKG